MKKLYSNTYLMRFLTAQLPSLALFVMILSNQIFKASLLVQICFYLILVSNLVLNLYFMNQVKKESSSDILSNQIFFTILTLALFIFSSYRLITMRDLLNAESNLRQSRTDYISSKLRYYYLVSRYGAFLD